jgi:predicted DNA-binding transcriptional regulator YafY
MKFPTENKKSEKSKSLVNQKIKRIIKLYLKATSEGGWSINIDEYCAEFSISERTLRRDVKSLKEIFPELYFSFNRNWSS